MVVWLCVGSQVARAETVTYQVTSGFGCSGPCPTASTPIAAFIAAEANWAQQNQPNHLDSQSLELPVLSGGVYTANGVFHATFGLTAAYSVTGTCPDGCTGNDPPAGTAWSSSPKMLQALFVAACAGLFFAGIKTGRTA